jgi:hypothetical protein
MLYAAVLPPVPHRTLVRYRIRAVDRGAQPAASVAPGPLDPEPNFAYFVYDGVPDYVAQHRSAFGPAGHVHTELDRVPVYHIVANGADVEEAQYTQYPEGGNHRWRVSLVHNGHVHDHVLLELRSGHRYSWPKRPWKIHMNRGNLFDGRTNDGTPYPRKRRKLHFMSAQHDPGKPRGESGVFESLAWRLFREAGVIGASTTFVQLRFVRSPEEHDQFLGDFFGIFLETQRIDSTALEDNGRPADSSAALYKMAGGPVKKHPDCTASLSDAQQFLADTNSVQTREWYEANLNLPTYLSFRVVVELTDDHDMDSLKNFFYYRPSPSQPWEVIPWDLDNTFGAESSGDEPLRNRVLPLFPVEYRNRFRFLWQVLYDEKRLFHGIDAWGDQIRGLADADLDRWDTEPREACPSWPQTTGANCKEYAPFLSRMRGLKIWIRNQTKITASAMRDALAPQTPANASPRPGWPAAAAVRLQTSAFAGPGEGGGHAATRWMVIERGGDWAFPAWTVDAPGAALETTVPADVTISGHEYLFRAAHQNASGRWSLLSEPTAFVAGRGDSTPPQPPSGLTAAWVSARGVELRWNTSADLESGVFGYVVRRDGEPLRPAPVREARIHDFRPSSPATHRYDVVAVNGAGLESSPSSPLDVVLPELTELGGWRLPDGGWDYIYDARDGEAAFTSGAAGLDGGNLDGTWARSRVDDWDGSPPGEPDGAPGGARLAVSEPEHAGEEPASVLSIEDAGSDAAPTLPPPANQRIYFLRPAGDGSLLEGGVTLLARWRVNPAPLDLPASKGQSPEAGSARGHFGLSQRGPGGDRTFALWLDEGRLFASGGVQLAVETTRFQAVWATIEPEGAAMRVRVYLNGNSSPSADEIVDLSASELESALGGNFLQMGLAHRADSGAIEIDFAGYKAGVHSPRPLAGGPQRFVRGDVDADGKAGLEDALDVLHYLFTAGPAFACIDAADADDSGSTEVTDAIYICATRFSAAPRRRLLSPPAARMRRRTGLPRCSAEGCRA